MGKYGIGARVHDIDGDLCEVIGKPARGLRDVRYNGGKHDGMVLTWMKANLEPANDNPSISTETSENAYSAVAPASDKPWVPKVGDRVTLNPASVWKCESNDGVGTVFPKSEDAAPHSVGVRFDGGDFLWHIEPSDLEPVVAPATTAAPVAVAEATEDWVPAVGDKVRCIDESGGIKFTVGDIYTVREVKTDGLVYVEENDGGMFAYRFEPAAAPAKFKVGDRVNWKKSRGSWQGCVITKISDAGPWPIDAHHHHHGGGSFDFDELELAEPSNPAIGSTVTFTATGRLSAINDNGHMQVTFPGLPAGRNSFALPADYVALAH
jgi:hypothetical protein